METLWSVTALALAAVGVLPGLGLCWRGTAVQRLIGLELLSACGVMELIALSMIVQQSSYLIVPLVLAVLTSAGTLVYTRLLRPESVSGGDA